MKLIHLGVAMLAALVFATCADAHNVPGPHNAIHAIHDYFPGQYFVPAANVAYCEGGEYSWLISKRPWDAGNGQYRGFFQMGSSERQRYGHGPGPWHQARAAWRYFDASGRDWSPWECKPWTKPMPRWMLTPFM